MSYLTGIKPGLLTRMKTGHKSGFQTPQMTDVSGEFLSYTYAEKTD